MKIYTTGSISGQSYDQVMTRYKNQVKTLQDMIRKYLVKLFF